MNNKSSNGEAGVIYKRSIWRLEGNSSSETMEARKQWHDIYEVLKEITCQSRNLSPAKLYFKIERGGKTVQD